MGGSGEEKGIQFCGDDNGYVIQKDSAVLDLLQSNTR